MVRFPLPPSFLVRSSLFCLAAFFGFFGPPQSLAQHSVTPPQKLPQKTLPKKTDKGKAAATSDADASEKADLKILAHYMPWFQNRKSEQGDGVTWSHWQWNGKGTKHDPNRKLTKDRHDIASVFYPLIGPYDSHDTRVLEYHILTAKLAGIDGFICNWYGPKSFTDQAVSQMLPIAERLDFKLAICMEEKTFFPPYCQTDQRSGASKEMSRQVSYLLDKHCNSKAYLRLDAQPLIFLFNGFGTSKLGNRFLSPDEMKQVRQTTKSQKYVLVRNQLNKEHFPTTDGLFAWCAPQEARAKFYDRSVAMKKAQTLNYLAAVASPGFNDSGVHGWGGEIRVTDRRDGDEYRENWAEVKALHSQKHVSLVQIVTWNDFEEGTTIEPTREYQFSYLDQTENEIEQLTSRLANTTDNQWGLEVFEMRCRLHLVSPEQTRQELAGELDRLVQKIVSQNNQTENDFGSRLAKVRARLDSKIEKRNLLNK